MTNSNMLLNAKITGVGYAVPERILTNFDLEKMVDTSDEWIKTRTGIIQRHIADDDCATSDIGIKAAKMALSNANIDPKEIDLILVATITPDMVFPATACLIQDAIGAENAGTLDIEAACSGFIYGIAIAKQFVATGEYKNVLVVAAETLSKITDWEDRSTCVLFGDGAGAVVISANEDSGPDASSVLATHLGGDGKFKDILCLPAGGSRIPASADSVNKRLHYMKMEGPEVFKAAVTKMRSSVNKVLQRCDIKPEQLRMVIPHQANLRIIDSLKKYLRLPDEKVYINLQRYGNTSAATIAIALAEIVEKNLINRGDLIVMCAFGGGLTWASALIRY